MDHYYGVVRSDSNTLSHYGIRGMKWGVRKAKMSGNMKKLSRAHKKAVKKLEKLNKQADIATQKDMHMKYAKRGAIGFGVSGLGMLGIGGSHIAKNIVKKDEMQRAILSPDWYGTPVTRIEQLSKHNAEFRKKYTDINKAKKASAIVDLAGLGYAGYNGIKGLSAYYRTTKKGHAKAVAKRDAWKNQMDEVFSGTKYKGQYTHPSNKKKRRSYNG